MNKLKPIEIVMLLCVGIAAIAFAAYRDIKKPSVASSPPVLLVAQQTVANKELPATISSDDKPADWHVVENMSGKCKPNEGPAHLIEIQKGLNSPYRVVDEKNENGRPVIVRVECPTEDFQVRYYRSKDLCQSALTEKKKDDSAELSRYK